MMEAVRTSETSVDNHFTRQYNPEDNSEHQVNLTVRFQKMKAYIRKKGYDTNETAHFPPCSHPQQPSCIKSKHSPVYATNMFLK
jgi:hypothetical protein